MYDYLDTSHTVAHCPSICYYIIRTLIPIMSDIVSINNKITINILNVMLDFDM